AVLVYVDAEDQAEQDPHGDGENGAGGDDAAGLFDARAEVVNDRDDAEHEQNADAVAEELPEREPDGMEDDVSGGGNGGGDAGAGLHDGPGGLGAAGEPLRDEGSQGDQDDD